jgi:hypothetical protein
MLADGGEAIADIDVLRHQAEVLGPAHRGVGVGNGQPERGYGGVRRVRRAQVHAGHWGSQRDWKPVEVEFGGSD